MMGMQAGINRSNPVRCGRFRNGSASLLAPDQHWLQLRFYLENRQLEAFARQGIHWGEIHSPRRGFNFRKDGEHCHRALRLYLDLAARMENQLPRFLSLPLSAVTVD